jgi:hypothetical protein
MTTNGTIMRLLLAAAIALCFSSCVSEDMTGCVDPRGNVRISLYLAEGVDTRGEELGDFDINGARVWAFDAESKQVSFVPAEQRADGRYEAWMNLPSGNYNFVVWTGDDSVYKVADTSGIMDEMVLFLGHSYDDPITEMIPDLLYGNAKGRVIDVLVNNEVEIAMIPDTYNVNVTAKGLTQGSDTWEVSIYKKGTLFLFDHTLLLDSGVFHHKRSGALTSSGQFASSMRIVAPGAIVPGADGDPQLVFRNVSTGEVRYDRSLVKTINDAYAANGQTVDFEHTYTYDIVLTFDASMGVTVSVNGWEYNTEPTDLG